jgi:hypothetical protein
MGRRGKDRRRPVTRRENQNCLSFSLKGLTVSELPCREYLQFPCGVEQVQTGPYKDCDKCRVLHQSEPVRTLLLLQNRE